MLCPYCNRPMPDAPRFANYDRAIDAVKVIFEETGKTYRPDDLAKIIANGGFRDGDPGARAHVLMSINIHEHGKGTYPLKRINNRVGPADWDEERFKL